MTSSAYSGDPTDYLLSLAREHLEMDRHAAAVELLAVYVRRRPSRSEAWWRYGNALRKLGRQREARRALLAALRRTKRHKGAVAIQFAMLYKTRGDRARAEKWFARAAASHDTFDVDWVPVLRGANFASWEKFDQAAACQREAIEMHGNNEDEARLNLGNVLRAQRDYAGAAAEYREALRITPDYPEAASDLASLEGVDDALKLIAESDDTGGSIMRTAHRGDPAERMLALAREHFDMDREAAAVELLAAYVARRPAHAPGWWRYGNALRILGRTHQARSALRTALGLTTEHRGAVAAQLAMLYEGHGKRALAEKWFARAAAAPDMADLDWIWVQRAENLATRGQIDQAGDCYRRAIEMHGNDQDMAYLGLGNVLRAQRDYAGAEAAYRRALEITPDHVEAISALSSLDGVQDALMVIEALPDG